VSYIHPTQTLGITPWNPQPALAIALLLVRGQRWLPVVLAAALGAEVLVRGAPAPWLAPLIVSCVLALGYAAVARALASSFAIRRSLDDVRDVVRLIGVVVAGAFMIAVLYVGALAALGTRIDEGFVVATLKFWIGDAVGILVSLPLLLMLIDPARRHALRRLVQRGETVAQAVAIGVALWIVFGLVDEPFKYFYVLVLPLMWVAARDGLPGAVLAVVLIETGVIVAVLAVGAPALTVFELQALQIALTITGLFLGVTVDERERAARALRQSTRLAAAGSMAGALVHELSQPLTALTGYARAALLLSGAQPLDAQRLDEALRKTLAEAQRATDVLQKVREFFSTGAPARTRTDVAALAHHVVESLQSRAQAKSVTVGATANRAALPLDVDPIQIELVLRNLLLNAIDAAAAGEREARRVELEIEEPGIGVVRLHVRDSGAGVAPDLAERVFEPFYTSKASGMGMGLAISRAIVQAHGGRLDVMPGPAGHFTLALPAPRAD
jgi:signal transduction histidine kinase